MNTQAICLAPSVMKSLAKNLRKQPLASHLSHSQSIEVVARILGHPSWFSAQQACPVPSSTAVDRQESPMTVSVLLEDKSLRRRFYTELVLVLQCGLSLFEGVQVLEEASRKTHQTSLSVLYARLLSHCREGRETLSFFEPLKALAPIEYGMLQTSVGRVGLQYGLEEALEMLS